MISTLLISPYLGAWVDLTPRLRAATTLTLVQVTSLLTSTTHLESLVNLLHQGAATAVSSVSLGLGLHNLASISSNHILLLLAFVLGTAAIGGLAAGGLTLLIQVPASYFIMHLFPPSERLAGCHLRRKSR